jgi:hypothetical protein
MRVRSPALFFQVPLADYALEGAYVHDSLSGASPFYHSTLSGASGVGIHDLRKAGDVKVTRYFDRMAIGLGTAFSSENDYDSNAVSMDARFFSADNNTTFAVGAGSWSDRIRCELLPDLEEKKRTRDFLVGVTQVLTANDLMQSNLTYTAGRGFYTDPYKLATGYDNRPDERKEFAWLTRYVHYVESAQAALHGSYRFYRNDWGINAHALELAWYQPAGNGWLVRPSLRYSTQRAADFYRDPPFPDGVVVGELYSADHRLAAWGAFTLGLKIAKDLGKGFTADLSYEWYEQRFAWRLGGNGSPGLNTFSAYWWVVGVNKKF